MKRNGFVIHASYDFKRYIQKNKRFVVMLAALVVGMCLGALIIRWQGTGQASQIDRLFAGYLSQRSAHNFFQTLLFSFLSAFWFVLLAFLSGMFIFGAPVAVSIALFKGLGYGLYSGYLYAAHGLQGVSFCALILVPSGLISSLAVLVACKEAYTFSTKLLGVFRETPIRWQPREEMRRYALQFGLVLALVFVSALVDSVMTLLFFHFFTF